MPYEIKLSEIPLKGGIVAGDSGSKADASEVSLTPVIYNMVGAILGDDQQGGVKSLPQVNRIVGDSGGDIFTANWEGTKFTGIGCTQNPSGTARDLYFTTDTGIFKKSWPSGTETVVKSAAFASSPTYVSVLRFENKFIFFPNSADTAYDESGNALNDMTRPDVTDGIGYASVAVGDEDFDKVRGQVKYYFAFIDTNGTEGPISAASAVYQADEGDQVQITFTPADSNHQWHSTQNAKVQVYRTFHGRNQAYMVPTGVVTLSTGAVTFTDSYADSELGELPLWHGDKPPPSCADVVSWAGRLFALAPMVGGSDLNNTLHWSDPDSYTSWWTAADGSNITVAEDDGDVGVKLIPDGDTMIIAKKNHMYRLRGRLSKDFRIDPIGAADSRERSYGIPHQRAVALLPPQHGGFVFFYSDGVHMYKDREFRTISDDIQSLIQGATAENCRVGYSSTYDQIFVTVDVATVLTTYIYSMSTHRWIGSFSGGYDVYFDGYDYTGFNKPRFMGLDDSAKALDFIGEGTDGPLGVSLPTAVADRSRTVKVGAMWGAFAGALKRFHYVDIIHNVKQDDAVLEVDILVDDTAVTLATNVALTTTADKFIRERINLGLYGHNVEVDFSGLTSHTDDTTPGRIWSIVVGWQEFYGDSR